MYSYSDYAPLTKEEIIKRVSQEEIYEIVTDYIPIVDKYIKSPLRQDGKAGAYYEWVKGILYFKDFADPKKKIRDCFQFVMEEFNLNYNDALLYVNDYFKIGLNNTGELKPVLYELKDYSSFRYKHERSTRDVIERNEIYTKTRQFSESDMHYWFARYGITRIQLIEDNVFPIIWYKFYSTKKKEWLLIRPVDLCYSYNEFENGFKKIYRPFAKNNGKWLTNCIEDHIGFRNKPLFNDKVCFITKAYKCARVIYNQKQNSRWFQSESMFPKKELLIELCNEFEKIIIWYDNDKAGIEGGKKLKSRILDLIPDKKVKGIIYPQNNLGIKDPSDLRHKKGEKELNNFINKYINQ